MNKTMTPNDVLEMYGGSFPVDPQEICKNIGIEVMLTELNGLSGKLETREDENKPPLILVNKNEPATRQRFTVAHELGHYFLGHGNSPREDTEFNLTPAVRKPEEIAANDFAAKLLMPKAYVEHFIFKEKIFDIKLLAEKFKVSTLSFHYRLKNLGMV